MPSAGKRKSCPMNKQCPTAEFIDTVMRFEACISVFEQEERGHALRCLAKNDFDLVKTCQVLGFAIPNPRNNNLESDLVQFIKRLEYVPKFDRKDYLEIFLDTWDLKESYNRLANQLVFEGNAAPKPNEWPYILPSRNVRDQLDAILDTIGDEARRNEMLVLFRMSRYNIEEFCILSGNHTPASCSNDYSPTAEREFKAIISAQLPAAQHEGALDLLRSNRFNVQTTCELLGLQNGLQRPKKKQEKKINVKFKEPPRPKAPLVWPNIETHTPAEIEAQLMDHPTVIDLHYHTQTEARDAIAKFLHYHREKRTQENVRIITGKGLNSVSDTTLKAFVKQLLKQQKVAHRVNLANTGEILVNIVKNKL